MGVDQRKRQRQFPTDLCRNREDWRTSHQSFFSDIQKRIDGLWVSDWKEFDEREDSFISETGLMDLNV